MDIKTLHLIRHADAVGRRIGEEDQARPLSARGVDDAQRLGEWLAERGVAPDTMLTSTAIRAHTTAKILTGILNFPTRHLILEEGLYLADVPTLRNCLQRLPDHVAEVIVIGHNPGISEFADYLVGHSEAGLAAAGLISLRIAVTAWAALGPGLATVQWTRSPR